MKVVTASTPEQQSYVRSLLDHFHRSILPSFFSESYVDDLKTFGVLCQEDLDEYTLQEIMEVTAALQTIQHILECLLENDASPQLARKFDRNQKIIEGHQIYFPFCFQDFTTTVSEFDLASVKPANHRLI
ncbi:DUF5365 family protein [Pontibacillus sp. HMF3514]|uniref:DUF5365 family protein n=1 Tax=Pontibacillus sp. HMF3514 TaxID=2692425 RepID=UPI0013204234|nr:DUF5365 family protein [Pontibacillus sp. HMF3514]QHE52444.1 hypothetical protein GS400_10550 [Pontibacillus sp. HMF3514]